jgi:hypothetical protein
MAEQMALFGIVVGSLSCSAASASSSWLSAARFAPRSGAPVVKREQTGATKPAAAIS